MDVDDGEKKKPKRETFHRYSERIPTNLCCFVYVCNVADDDVHEYVYWQNTY